MNADWWEKTRELIRRDAGRMACLEAAAALCLPDWYLAAGFLRNAIWEEQHQKITPLYDVDVVYFDAVHLEPAAEQDAEKSLHILLPGIPWEVRNQAHMHLRNQHAPYRGAAHALAHGVETPTCVGIRLETPGQLTLVAPLGFEENWSLRVTPNPAVHYPARVYNERVRQKKWLELWPQ